MRMLWASLTLLTQIGKENALIRVRHVGGSHCWKRVFSLTAFTDSCLRPLLLSGTIRNCQLELIRINRDFLKQDPSLNQQDDMDDG